MSRKTIPKRIKPVGTRIKTRSLTSEKFGQNAVILQILNWRPKFKSST